MIPKIIHQVWLGDKAIPEKFINWRKNLLKLNKNWEYIFWNEKNIPKIKCFQPSIYKKLINAAEKSDYIRLCVLFEYGGIYCDMDIEPIKSFNSLTKYNFIIGEEFSEIKGKKILCNGLIGASKKNYVIESIIKQIPYHLEVWGNSSYPSIFKLGPNYVTPLILSQKNKVKIFPPRFFHPKPWWQNTIRKNQIKKETFCIHHYSTSWKGKIRNFIDNIKLNLIKRIKKC